MEAIDMTESGRRGTSLGPWRRVRLVLVWALAVWSATPALGLMTSQKGNDPLSPANYTEWPGIVDVINDGSRVFHVWVNGNEDAFFRGDTLALERVLEAFARSEIDERVVVLRPGSGALSERVGESKSYDWQLNLVGGISRGLLDEDGADLIWGADPTLTVYTGGNIDLKQLRIPAGVTTLIEPDELRDRYLRAMRSTSAHVRSYAAYLLASIDPYGEESASAVAELAKDEKVRNAVERALAEFAERAKDPPETRERHRVELRQIRQFVFAWRYPWLKTGIGLTLVVATALLVATLGAVAWKRSGRRRGELAGAAVG